MPKKFSVCVTYTETRQDHIVVSADDPEEARRRARGLIGDFDFSSSDVIGSSGAVYAATPAPDDAEVEDA